MDDVEILEPGGYFAHRSAVVDSGAQVGEGTRIWHFTHVLTGSRIGRGCVVGQGCCIGPDAVVGDGCKVQNNVSIFRGVVLEDNVFCGPSAVFTNVLAPRAFLDKMPEARPTLVRRGATIGANATVVCGHTVGRFAMVGAGAVVTRDVEDHALVTGNPARPSGWVCECGERLDAGLVCPACDTSYRRTKSGLAKKESGT